MSINPRPLTDRVQPSLRQLGPGLITGAADDDPSGIATYSQAGAQFGFGMLWTVVFALPLMAAIQMVSARIGFVTGQGLSANIRAHHPRWLLQLCVGMLLGANTVNIGADLAAMAEALRILVGGSAHVYALTFGLLCLALQVFLPYERYVGWLKWLTLALFAYVAVVLTVRVDWLAVARAVVWPALAWNREVFVAIVAVLGTTISPYLFFWQAAQEVEDKQRRRPDAGQVQAELARIRTDTWIGMGISELVAASIMISAAVTLHAGGVRNIETAAQAAEALRPVAGEFAFLLFGLGIIGTGMLAVPVLAGSAAYAVAGAAGWEGSLALNLRRGEGQAFYGVIAVATVFGVILCFTPTDPMQELYWSAVINGVVAVPIMAVLMRMASNPRVMGEHVIEPRLRWLGWLATVIMGVPVLGMFFG